MHDPRIDQLADILLDHSCRTETGREGAHRGVRSARADARLPAGRRRRRARRPCRSCRGRSNAVLRSLYQTATEESMKLAGEFETARMEQMQAYIGIRGAANSSQFADVPHEQMDLYQQHWWKTVHTDVRVAEDEVGRAALSDRFVRPGGQHEHAGVRGFLLRRLHGRLRRDGRGPEAAGRADAGGRPRADRRARHGAGVLDQGHPGDPLLRASATFPTAKCSPPRSATASTA